MVPLLGNTAVVSSTAVGTAAVQLYLHVLDTITSRYMYCYLLAGSCSRYVPLRYSCTGSIISGF